VSISIVATPGSASANSFVTEAEFVAYAATRLNTPAGTSAAEPCSETEKKAMIDATREITDLEGWIGYRVGDTQVLSWPRQAAINPLSPFGALFATNEIPQLVKDATVELALEFIKAGTIDIAKPDPNANVIEKTIDVLTTKYASPSERLDGLARYPRVMTKLGKLLEGVSGSVRLVR
jgi:hypothetical protein